MTSLNLFFVSETSLLLKFALIQSGNKKDVINPGVPSEIIKVA